MNRDAHTSRADRLLENPDLVPIISDFSRTEYASAVANALRDRRITETDAHSAFMRLDTWTRLAAKIVATEGDDILRAEQFIRRLDLTLRTQDAIHIAIALRIDAALATFDRRMADAARSLALAVLDA